MDFPCEDLLQSIFGVLHIVTLVPYSRKLIMNMSQRNGRLIDIIFDSIGKPEPLDDRVRIMCKLYCFTSNSEIIVAFC